MAHEFIKLLMLSNPRVWLLVRSLRSLTHPALRLGWAIYETAVVVKTLLSSFFLFLFPSLRRRPQSVATAKRGKQKALIPERAGAQAKGEQAKAVTAPPLPFGAGAAFAATPLFRFLSVPLGAGPLGKQNAVTGRTCVGQPSIRGRLRAT
jgi:hypothetical protein